MMKAPLRSGRDSTRRRCNRLAVEDTSTDGPVVAAIPGVTARGPKTGAAVCALLTYLLLCGFSLIT